MHRRGMPRTTRTHRTAAAVAVLTVGATLGVVGPAQADRVTPADVEKAFHEAEVANEQANQLEEDVKEARAEIADLDADIADQLAVYERQRKALGASVVQQQLDNPLGPTASLFGSKDPQQFLEGLGAVQALNSTRADAVEAFAATGATLVLPLAIPRIRDLMERLLPTHGPDCPVVVVHRASQPEELVLRGTVATIADPVEEAGLRQAAVVLVGRALTEATDSAAGESWLYSAERSRT